LPITKHPATIYFVTIPFFLSFVLSFEDALHQVDVFYLLSLWTKRSVLTLENHTTPHYMTLDPEEDFNTTKHGRLEEAILEGGVNICLFLKSDIHSFILAYNEKRCRVEIWVIIFYLLSSLSSLLIDWPTLLGLNLSFSLSLPWRHSAPCVFLLIRSKFGYLD